MVLCIFSFNEQHVNSVIIKYIFVGGYQSAPDTFFFFAYNNDGKWLDDSKPSKSFKHVPGVWSGAYF